MTHSSYTHISLAKASQKFTPYGQEVQGNTTVSGAQRGSGGKSSPAAPLPCSTAALLLVHVAEHWTEPRRGFITSRDEGPKHRRGRPGSPSAGWPSLWSEGAAFPQSLSTDNSSQRQKGSRRCPMSLLWNNEDLPGGPPTGAPHLLGRNRTMCSGLNPLFGQS